MKIELNNEELKKAIAHYTRERVLAGSEYRDLEGIEVHEDGTATVQVASQDLMMAAPAPIAPNRY